MGLGPRTPKHGPTCPEVSLVPSGSHARPAQVVGEERFALSRDYSHRVLSPVRLLFRHSPISLRGKYTSLPRAQPCCYAGFCQPRLALLVDARLATSAIFIPYHYSSFLFFFKVKTKKQNNLFSVVPREGLEPSRSYDHWILSPTRIPVPPPRRIILFSKFYILGSMF